MATHYIDNASSGSQYYFTTTDATTSQTYQSGNAPVKTTYSSTTYSTYPAAGSSPVNQKAFFSNTYQTPQQYQSVAGFDKSAVQQHYHTSQTAAAPQARATARAISSQDRYYMQQASPVTHSQPQHLHIQYDSRQQPGQPTGSPVVYQTPGAAQYTHHNVDTWTEGSAPNYNQQVQAQRVSVRSVSTGSQQSHSVSPQRHQDQLQQYYSQLTPEQHQHLLRQQQIQQQQEQNTRHEQQHRVAAHQVSSHQQKPVRSEYDRQRQDEEDYFAAQRQLAAQRAVQQQLQKQQQHDDEPPHPVGIRNLMDRFVGPTATKADHSRSKSNTSRHYSSSSYSATKTTNYGTRPTAASRPWTTHTMTYSSLPKPIEPPVNTVEYYQMQMQSGGPFTSIQQAAAPVHIQHTPTSPGTPQDRFKRGSLPEDYSHAQNRQQQQQQQHPINPTGGDHLSSIRNNYMNQVRQSEHEEPHAQPVHISRTILGEDLPPEKVQPAPQVRVQQPKQSTVKTTMPPPPVQQQPPASSAQTSQQQQQQQIATTPPSQPPTAPEPEVSQQQSTPATQTSTPQSASTSQATKQQSTSVTSQAPNTEQPQTNDETVEQKVISSEVTSSPTTDTATA